MRSFSWLGLLMLTGCRLIAGVDRGAEQEAPIVGCEDAVIAMPPEDPSAWGVWPVGVKTVTIGSLTVEVWYPAEPGSEEGIAPKRYDVRDVLPESERLKVSDEDNPWQDCNCYPELPIDDRFGPYPVVIFIHGFAGYRAQSLEQTTHWASRGFVVLATEHPGLFLADALAPICGNSAPAPDPETDVRAMLDALTDLFGDLEFLAGRIDVGRVGVVGHSAGGAALEHLGDVAQVLVPMASRWPDPPAHAPASTLVLGALADSVVDYAEQQAIYEIASTPKRLVGIANTGHLAFSSLCALANAAGDDFVEIGKQNGVCGLALAGGLFQCSDDFISHELGWRITNYATAAALEETLHCNTTSAQQLADIQARFSEVAEYREDLGERG